MEAKLAHAKGIIGTLSFRNVTPSPACLSFVLRLCVLQLYELLRRQGILCVTRERFNSEYLNYTKDN